MPVTIDGKPRQLLLETTSGYTKIDEQIAVADNLPVKDVWRDIQVRDGSLELHKAVTVPDMKLGIIPRNGSTLFIRPKSEGWGAADGSTGMNLFAGFDLELDLAHNRIGLFLPDHCAFTPYWPYDVVGKAPFRIELNGIVIMTMELDGQKVEVAINSTEENSSMNLIAARMLLKINPETSKMQPTGKTLTGKQQYSYPLTSLGSENLTIKHPDIRLTDDDIVCGGIAGRWYNRAGGKQQCVGGGDIILGWRILRQLRLFFDFKEKQVYFTLTENSPLTKPTSGIPSHQ